MMSDPYEQDIWYEYSYQVLVHIQACFINLKYHMAFFVK